MKPKATERPRGKHTSNIQKIHNFYQEKSPYESAKFKAMLEVTKLLISSGYLVQATDIPKKAKEIVEELGQYCQD